ncbi:MAG: replication protein [Ruminococcus sp.]|nr:replication protein [Ruminococcus sp.]
MASNGKSNRSKYYSTIVYTESAPPDWLEILQSHFVPAFVSPCHDSDVTEDGEIKKSHYHVMLLFDGLKSVPQAQEIFDSIGGVGCEKIKSLRGHARYLCHLDNPEKAQYSPDDVIALCGADYKSIIALPDDKCSTIGEIFDFCVENDIIYYSRLVMYARKNNDVWFKCLINNASCIVPFLRSLEYEKQREESALE